MMNCKGFGSNLIVMFQGTCLEGLKNAKKFLICVARLADEIRTRSP
jgi:hypothetical protein